MDHSEAGDRQMGADVRWGRGRQERERQRLLGVPNLEQWLWGGT